METIACDLCGSTRQTMVYQSPDRRYFLGEIFTVVQCDECGLGFLNPRPTFEEMGKYYPPAYYEEEFSSNLKYHQARYAREARYLREFEKRGGSRHLLDVGCANGDFPRFMAARGWNVEGVEVSASTLPIHDFPVYPQPFPEIPLDTPTYDAVTAWAVLEHVHNPMSYFKKASRVLKPGGLFVFLVPNFVSMASRYLFREDVPRHLYFYTRETVRQYVESTGLCLEREDNCDEIFSMPPENFLLFFLKARVLKKGFFWQDLPPSRPQYFQSNRLRPGLRSSLKYAFAYPLRTLDWALRPAAERIQMLHKTYGTSTYVARKI
ncbi:MAG TPA: class I SAM-dependent methyltransferase [Terriglobia bacterium]|nr:class I SAM-dependent methyltransferase [Terriglobia bacterium]